MIAIALDASVAMTWCYPDEQSIYAYAVLDALDERPAVVPAHWRLEIANAVLFGERKGRLSASEVLRFFALLESLAPITDTQTSARSLTDTMDLARRYGLTSYDAAYLELAMRENLVLATLDEQLRRAAEAAGVRTFQIT
jgi:predicted nucleic acid-binding protein